MITKESIINWLKENDIFERVSNNVEECTAEKIGISYTLDQLLDVMFKAKLPIRNFLTMAFDWRMVPEEYDFWEEKNITFREWVDAETSRVSSNKVLEAFINFLNEKGIREKFEHNMKSDTTYKICGIYPYRTVESFVQRVCSAGILNPIQLVSYAFKWEDTSEGRDFWKEMDLKWIKIYSEL